jgi:hypothetical protein
MHRQASHDIFQNFTWETAPTDLIVSSLPATMPLMVDLRHHVAASSLGSWYRQKPGDWYTAAAEHHRTASWLPYRNLLEEAPTQKSAEPQMQMKLGM